jgi:uncharacterized protein YkwD
MKTDVSRLGMILLLGLSVLPLPVAYAKLSVDAGEILLDSTPTPDVGLPSLADQPTATPTPTVTATPAATSTPFPTPTSVPTSAPVSPPVPVGSVPLPVLDDAAMEQWVADQLNQQRIARGLPPLAWVPELAEAARKHSRDMADHGFNGHMGSDGSDSRQRIADAGYAWTARGEIIGWGYGGDPGKMVSWWMSCPVHRPIILSGRFSDFGVGYVSDPESEWGYYWTVDFGRRADPASSE